MTKCSFVIFILVLLSLGGRCQILVGFSKEDSTVQKESGKAQVNHPDKDRNDIPFIDYKKAVIWTSRTDTVSDYVYIRKNFTDQMLSVWSHPKRLYPASRVYGVDMEGKRYRAVKVSSQNYVFAEQVVEGRMNLYMYRRIPQMNGWVEFQGYDSIHSGYRNNMIIEQEGMRSKQNYFGYFISIGDDTLRPVTTNKMRAFADTYLMDTPRAYAKALKYVQNNNNKAAKVAIASLMSVGIIGLTTSHGGGLIFLLGFPAAALVSYLNRPRYLHWQDMVEIVKMHNEER